MAMKPKTPAKSKKSKKNVKFKYVIPDHVRDCHVSGAWGGLLSNGVLHMHFFNERSPIPNHVMVEIGEDGSASEIDKDTGGDVVRLVQASVIMDMNTASSIRDWLDKMIKSFEDKLPDEIKDQIKADRAKKG
jgi:hypothetical protein